ncbi:glycosyltransferase [Rhodohalobacter sp. 8-1]|uniref:glycosyltransferase n=1 Tax=Rhodohalobacter sp. 8-1 TaxID=3131972 RepID=UPI0030EC507D
MDNKLKFSVIVPVYNNWDQLQFCIDALAKQSYNKDSFEIIVVDNGSDKQLPDDFSYPANMRIEYEPEPGSYTARNHGAKDAAGNYLAFTDSDCIPDENWLKNASDLFESNECDSIGGEIKVFRPEDGRKHAYIYDKYHAFKQKTWVPEGKSCTANHFVKRDVFESVNGFDTSLKSGGDWEFSQRCVKLGYSMKYGADVVVRHPARKNLRAVLKKHYRHICWNSIIIRRKFKCSQVRFLLSSLKGSLSRFFRSKSYAKNAYDRAVVFYVDFIKMTIQFFVNGLILMNVIDPQKVRE